MRRGYRHAPNPKALVDRAVHRGVAECAATGSMGERVAMAGRVRRERAGFDVAGCSSTSLASGVRQTPAIVTQRAGPLASSVGQSRIERGWKAAPGHLPVNLLEVIACRGPEETARIQALAEEAGADVRVAQGSQLYF